MIEDIRTSLKRKGELKTIINHVNNLAGLVAGGANEGMMGGAYSSKSEESPNNHHSSIEINKNGGVQIQQQSKKSV